MKRLRPPFLFVYIVSALALLAAWHVPGPVSASSAEAESPAPAAARASTSHPAPAGGCTAPSTPHLTPADEHLREQFKGRYGNTPLSFEVNAGQADARVKYLARGKGYSLFLTSEEVVMVMGRARRGARRDATVAGGPATEPESPPAPDIIRMKLGGAHPPSSIEGMDELSTKSNYLIGNNRGKWRTGVHTYGRVKYKAVYPGIDVVYYGRQHRLEYDFIIAPGAAPSAIRLNFEGLTGLRVDGNGDLVLRAAGGEMRQHRPQLYQETASGRRDIAGRYVIEGKDSVRFEVGSYDAARPLVIDPELSYLSYVGGSLDDYGNAVAVDCAGSVYVTGTTYLIFPDYTVTTVYGGFEGPGMSEDYRGDVFVTKLSPEGDRIIYTTFLGGNGVDVANAMAVDAGGRPIIAGETGSVDFPGPFGNIILAKGVADAFVTVLNESGDDVDYTNLIGSNSSEWAEDVAVDKAGYIYVVGRTYAHPPSYGYFHFATTPGAFQEMPGSYTGYDGFVVKLYPRPSPVGGINDYLYSTFLGGEAGDSANAVAVDDEGNAYVTGFTTSPNFPTINSTQGYSGCDGGGICEDMFVAKLNPSGSALVYSKLYGEAGKRDEGFGVAADGAGNAVVVGAGTTYSDVSEFNTGVVMKFDPSGQSLFNYQLPGNTKPDEVALDALGGIHIVGKSAGGLNTTSDAASPGYGGGESDAFMMTLKPTGVVAYASYIGGADTDEGRGIAVHQTGDVFVSGTTMSDGLNTDGAALSGRGGGRDAFVAKFEQNLQFPVIFIPGIAGSRLYDPDLTIPRELWPGIPHLSKDRLSLAPGAPHDNIYATDAIRSIFGVLHFYDRVLDMLVQEGGLREYQVNGDPARRTTAGCDMSQMGQDGDKPNLFVFAYDWRRGNEENVARLKDYVGCVQRFYGKDVKVNLLAHSMGGLLARRYILDNNKDHHVSKLITVASPWLGAPKGTHVLETGKYDGLTPYIIAEGELKGLVEFFRGAHQLLPSREYFNMADKPPFSEQGDFNNNGIPDEEYTYTQALQLIDSRHRWSYPASAGRDFHENPGQDDWSDDRSCVQYHHIIGERSTLDTIGQVIARRVPQLRPDSFTLGMTDDFETKVVRGDGTVPTVSAARFQHPNTNLNAPNSHRWYLWALNTDQDKLVDHTGLTKTGIVHEVILYLLGRGPRPPGFEDPSMESLTGSHPGRAAAATTQLSSGLQTGLNADDADVPPKQPSYYLTVSGVQFVTVTDSAGNTNEPIDGMISNEVPGVGYHQLAQQTVFVTFPADKTFNVKFKAGTDPFKVQWLKGVGNQTPTLAVRYMDQLLPPGTAVMFTVGPQGVEDMRLDNDGDGNFETTVSPTVSATGPAAQDVRPPTVTVSDEPQQGSSTLVTVTATDAGAGVKTVYYSLDRSHYEIYQGPFSVDTSAVRIVYAFADDNVANRSDLVTYQLNRPAHKLAFVSDRDGNNEIYVMNPDGSEQTRLTDNPADDLDPVWSPDGTKIAFQSNRDGVPQLYVMNADGTGQARLTNDSLSDELPAWSPDGTRIAFRGDQTLYLIAADGSNPTHLFAQRIAGRPVWSPDGTRIVFSGIGNYNPYYETNDQSILVVNPDGGGNQTPLALTSGGRAFAPTWSPDGTRIAYRCQSPDNYYMYNLCLVYANGAGQTTLVSSTGSIDHPTWSPDASRIAFERTDGYGLTSIHTVRDDGGGLTNLTTAALGTQSPQWSPEGDRLVYTAATAEGRAVVNIINADGSGPATLTDGTTASDSSALWKPFPGIIPTPTPAPMPSPTPTPESTPTPTPTPESTPEPTPTPGPPSNERIVFDSGRDGNNDIYMMNPDGSEQVNFTRTPTVAETDPVLSPDGTRIAFVSGDADSVKIYVMNVDGSGRVALTNNTGNSFAPAWSPDGTKIAFQSNRDGHLQVYVMNADGSNPTNLSNNSANESDPVWSPDGARIAFSSDRGDGHTHIHLMNADGSGAVPLTDTINDSTPAWSPDGMTIAYTSGSGGNNTSNVYTIKLDDSTETKLTNFTFLSGSIAVTPSWSPDSDRIVFVIASGSGSDVWSMRADGSEQRSLTHSTGYNSYPSWVRFSGAPPTPIPTPTPTPTPTPSADLSVTTAASVNPAELGRIFTYTISVSNAGPHAANDVTVRDALPSGVTFTSATPSQGSCVLASRTLTCQLGSVASGGSAGIALQVKPRQTGSLSNTASVTAAEADPNSLNNSAMVQTTVIKTADLKVTNTDSADPVFAGDQLTYTMLVNNLGPLNGATNVVVTDALPSSMTFVSATTTKGSLVTPPVGSTGLVTANLGSMAVNTQAVVTVTVKATQAGTVTATATVSADENDLNTANNIASQTTLVKPAGVVNLQKVLLAKQVMTGGCESTTGQVYLTSPAPAGGVSVMLSSNISGVTVPSYVDIPGGATVSPAFTVTTNPVTAKQVGLVTATSGPSSVSRGVTINVGSGTCP